MAKEQPIVMDGTITEALPNAFFTVELDNGVSIRCTISGKIRTNYIKLYPGDNVKIEMSPYDLTQGRIVYRYK